MYWLKDNGFIQTKPPNTDREFYEGIHSVKTSRRCGSRPGVGGPT